MLLGAGLLEVGWAIGIKYTDGFTRLWPSVFTIFAMIGSMGLLGRCIQTLPVGTAYAVWTGIGVVGTVVFGILAFNESTAPVRILSVLMILAGIIGLRIFHA
jgi:quaternary ammonium compound-resistance protein SugE